MGGVCAVVALTAHYKSTLALSSPNWIVATVVADSARHHIRVATPANVKQKMRRRNVSHERIEPCGVWVLDENEWRKTKKENIVFVNVGDAAASRECGWMHFDWSEFEFPHKNWNFAYLNVVAIHEEPFAVW